MIFNFKQFLNENVTGREIVDKEYIKKILSQHKEIKQLFRGINYELANFDFQRCVPISRKSVSSNNLHNLIISNDKRFSAFQNRSKSTFCSDYHTASYFGKLYLLVPETDCMFSYIDAHDLLAICGDPDSNYAAIRDIFKFCGFTIQDDNYNEFIRTVNYIEENFNYIDITQDIYYTDSYTRVVPLSSTYACKNSRNLSQLIDNLYNFNNLRDRMKNIKYSEITNIIDREYWTESPHILIKNELAEELVNELFNN
jgi:hypothetical protein